MHHITRFQKLLGSAVTDDFRDRLVPSVWVFCLDLFHFSETCEWLPVVVKILLIDVLELDTEQFWCWICDKLIERRDCVNETGRVAGVIRCGKLVVILTAVTKEPPVFVSALVVTTAVHVTREWMQITCTIF
jgi:hypothetical protein